MATLCSSSSTTTSLHSPTPKPSPLHLSSPSLPSLLRNRPRPLRLRRLTVRNIDAAQPFDLESKLSQQHIPRRQHQHQQQQQPPMINKLKIGIIGFGNFGQFLAKTLVLQGHVVLAHSRSDHSDIARSLGVRFFPDPNDLCEDHPDVILLCTSIISTESVLKSLPLGRLRRSTLFVDVLSVKEFPRNLFLKYLEPDFDILCTHPMFGPESGKDGWSGLPFVYDKVRVGKGEGREKRVEAFIDVFRREGCEMVEMSCAEHDDHAAGSQFITHLVGRVLQGMELRDTPINTKGYKSMLDLVENTSKDSFELFYGLFLYNKNAMEQLERMDLAFEMVKRQLIERMHALVRKQLVGLEGEGSEAVGLVKGKEKVEKVKKLLSSRKNEVVVEKIEESFFSREEVVVENDIEGVNKLSSNANGIAKAENGAARAENGAAEAENGVTKADSIRSSSDMSDPNR
ncbi:Arogenate dehydrogenase 2, chloroplastic-like protein, partial [Drosera capensis]